MALRTPSTNPGEPVAPAPVRKRAVFYISGFDPQGPGHYHRLLTEQARLQATVTDYRLDVGPRTSPEPLMSSWSVSFRQDDGFCVHNSYHFLRWDDIVRTHWPRGRLSLARVTCRTALHLLLNGSWLSMCRTSWVAGLTLALPAVIGLLGLGLGIAGLIMVTLWIQNLPLPQEAHAAYMGGLLALLAMASQLPSLWRFGQGAWLMRSTASLLRYARGQAPDIDTRISAWSSILRKHIQDDETDEVLVVAHSSGCIGAVSALARAIQGPPPHGMPSNKPIGLLTLGQCIPVLSHQPEAKGFRTELWNLGTSEAVTWVDVSAPPDACCFALIDPCANPHSPQNQPSSVKRLSPRYAEQMSSRSYQTLKKNKYRCHFQYLMAFESPVYFDFFRWVCGSKTLAQTTQNSKNISNFKRFNW